MLEKRLRLKKRKQFNYIYKNGRTTGCDCLTLVYNFCRMRDTPMRIGFSASKKVGNSVKRHRATRILRHAIKSFIPRMTQNHNYIIVAKDTLLQKTPAEITRAIEYVLKKSNLLTAPPCPSYTPHKASANYPNRSTRPQSAESDGHSATV